MIKFSKLKFNIFQVVGILFLFKFIEDKRQGCDEHSNNTEKQNHIQTEEEKTADVDAKEELLAIHLCHGSHEALSLKENCQNLSFFLTYIFQELNLTIQKSNNLTVHLLNLIKQCQATWLISEIEKK